MPYKIVMRKMDTEIPEVHYIHALHTRDAKRKALKFFIPEIQLRKVDYIRTTELMVREECGVYED